MLVSPKYYENFFNIEKSLSDLMDIEKHFIEILRNKNLSPQQKLLKYHNLLIVSQNAKSMNNLSQFNLEEENQEKSKVLNHYSSHFTPNFMSSPHSEVISQNTSLTPSQTKKSTFTSFHTNINSPEKEAIHEISSDFSPNSIAKHEKSEPDLSLEKKKFIGEIENKDRNTDLRDLSIHGMEDENKDYVMIHNKNKNTVYPVSKPHIKENVVTKNKSVNFSPRKTRSRANISKGQTFFEAWKTYERKRLKQN